jgi:hypothetical protein
VIWVTKGYCSDENRDAVSMHLLQVAIPRRAALLVAIAALERGWGGC